MIDKFTGPSRALGAPHSASGPATEERTQIAILAQQFEAMLISQMLREMKDSLAEEQEAGGFGADILGETVNSEFAMALSRSGGLGLAESLMKSLHKLDTKSVDAVEVAAPAPADAGFRLPDPAVSSGFGYRVDPFSGQHKFHAGTDIKLAYGEDVRAAADGVVTFAGELPGYGMLVKVDHGGGLETRYAHLSAMTVSEGMSVDAGSPIARSGNSGRSTGPHLHFEVRKDGQPIDSASVIGLVPVAVTGVPASR